MYYNTYCNVSVFWVVLVRRRRRWGGAVRCDSVPLRRTAGAGGVQRGERPPGESRGERSGKLPFSACGKWYNLLYHFDKWVRLCYNRLDNDFQGGVG